MALDLRTLSLQLEQMVGYLRDAQPLRAAQYDRAHDAFTELGMHWEEIAALTRASAIRYVTAIPLEDPLQTFRPIELPETFSVIATDGSQIEPERHALAQYFVINTGWAELHYGPDSHAVLGNSSDVHYRDDQLWFELADRRVPILDELLATLRTLAERTKLAELLEAQPRDRLTLGLADGSLLDWSLDDRAANIPKDIAQRVIDQLDRMRDSGHLLASYISRPAAREVANLTRVVMCSDQPVMDCRHCSSLERTGHRACEAASILMDTDLLGFIPEYHRSALFEPQQRAQKRYPGHTMRCFYLNTGVEIARVEVPEWIANDAQRLSLVHALVAKQCERGRYHGRLPGYPPSLIEAHEQAVLDGNDRLVFDQLLERRMIRAGLRTDLSAKRVSKHMKAV